MVAEHEETDIREEEVILEEEALSFSSWLKSLESVPLIRGIQQQVEQARVEELEKASRYLKDLSEEQQKAVERMSKAMMKRFIHPTMQTLKTLPDDIEGDLLMGAASRLFAAKPMKDSKDKHRESDEHASG